MRSEMIERISEHVEEMGWAVTGVAEDEMTQTPRFAYTTGFNETLGVPDLVLISFDPHLAHSIFKAVFDRVKYGEISLSDDGGKVDGIIQKFPVRLDKVSEDAIADFAFCTRAYDDKNGRQSRFLHMLLPDKNGKFPGEPGVDTIYENIQSIERITEGADRSPTMH